MYKAPHRFPEKVHLRVPRLAHYVNRCHPLLGHCVLPTLSFPDKLMKHTVAFPVNRFSTTSKDTTMTGPTLGTFLRALAPRDGRAYTPTTKSIAAVEVPVGPDAGAQWRSR